MASTKETSAVPALDAEILTAVRALNTYPKRHKDKTQDLLAMRIAKRWLDLLPSTREKLEALQKYGAEDLHESVEKKLVEELRDFGRKPVEYKKPATPAQEHEKLLANKFCKAKQQGKLSSSQIKELKAIWASNSGGKHPVVTMAHGSSELNPNLLPCSVGIHHAADPTDINFEHCQELLERQQEHLERQQERLKTLKSILLDVKTRPSDSRIRELAERLKVPEQVDEQFLPLDLVFKSVQQQFHDEVCELQSKSRTMSSTNPAAKRARFATAVASSGGPHAAPSNRVDEVESFSSCVGQSAAAQQPTSHAGHVLHTGSSDVAQLAATCQEPRSTVLFMKILEPIWAIEVADGQKMFECVANKTKWHNQFKHLSSGDLFIVVMKGRGNVNAVCEVASPAIVKKTSSDVLKSKLQESRHAALDAYLDGAESFDYVEFKHVFDCRCFLSVSSTAAFLDHVGLALPKSPLVGLLRPVVLDEQWHSRLHEYMQQTILRLPVSLAIASGKTQVSASNADGHVDEQSDIAKRCLLYTSPSPRDS